MKIKIDKKGCLEIERAGKFKKQHCPYTNDGFGCGDWCPLFTEIEVATIILCNGKAIHGSTEDFIDGGLNMKTKVWCVVDSDKNKYIDTVSDSIDKSIFKFFESIAKNKKEVDACWQDALHQGYTCKQFELVEVKEDGI